MDTLTDTGAMFDRATLHRAYWCGRDYWRERAEIVAPNLAPREHIRMAHTLHSLNFVSQAMESAGIPRDDYDIGANLGEIVAMRRTLDPRDVAHRVAAIAFDNVSGWRDGDPGRDPRWTAPGAPDPFEGSRHQMTKKRSRKGRTDVKVTRSGVAPVIGRADRTAPVYVNVTRQVGTPVLGPMAWRSLAREYKCARRIVERATYVPAVPEMPSLHSAMGLHLLEHGPRRANGVNALHVMATTTRLYGEPMCSELTEHPEITPPLPAFDPIGVAVHRVDMSGQTGVLALTQSLDAHDTARQRDRLTLPKLRTLKSDRDRGQMLSADDEPRTIRDRTSPDIERDDAGRMTYVPRANHQHDHRAAYAPPVWFAVDSHGTVTPDDRPRVWFGHHLVKRGQMARTDRGNRARRTIGTLMLTAFTESAVRTIAADLNAGERIVIETPDGTTARLNRANDGRYSATLTAADGTRINPKPFRTRTVDAIARKVTHAAA